MRLLKLCLKIVFPLSLAMLALTTSVYLFSFPIPSSDKTLSVADINIPEKGDAFKNDDQHDNTATITNNKGKYAYALYAPDEAYLCYALVNVDRLFSNMEGKESASNNEIDVILVVNTRSGVEKVCTVECFPKGRLRVVHTPEPGESYDINFGLFEPIGITDYERIVVIDADGLVIRNLDHLFKIELKDNQIATSVSARNNSSSSEILTTMIMTFRPSARIFEAVSQFQQPDIMAKAISRYEKDPSFSYSSTGDMLLNYMHQHIPLDVKRLPANYTAFDTTFHNNNNDQNNPEAYFVAFEKRPLENPAAGPAAVDDVGGNGLDEKTLNGVIAAVSSKNDSGDRPADHRSAAVHPLNIFWGSFYKRCDGLMEQS